MALSRSANQVIDTAESFKKLRMDPQRADNDQKASRKRLRNYSGTSDKGPSEIGATSLQKTKLLAPKCPLFRGSTVAKSEKAAQDKKLGLTIRLLYHA